MKYVWILVAVVILVRIDMVLMFVENQLKKLQSRPAEVQISGEVTPPSKLVPMEKDLTLKTSSRTVFFSMLSDFSQVPDENFKIKAIEILRDNPTMFNEKLDSELESTIYRWRDLISQKNPEAFSFALEIMKSLKGENLHMMRRFLSHAIDVDIKDFLSKYYKSADLNCMIMGYVEDSLPIEEKFNELSDRSKNLEATLSQETLSPEIKAYGQRCQIVLKLQLDKIRSLLPPVGEPEPAQPSPENTAPPAEASLPDSEASPGPTP